MKLYVIRHGIASDATAGTSDDERGLTQEGREKFAASVRGLERLGTRFDLVLHSPLLRAVQSADLLARLAAGSTRVSAHLAEPPSDALLEELQGESVAVVGHEPWVSELVSWLVTGSNGYGHAFALKKGGLIALEGLPRPGDMVLTAALPPSIARELGS